jgi:hypothetical protein
VIDGGCAIDVGDGSAIPANIWTWVDYQNGNTATPITISMTAGTHTVKLVQNASGVGVARILFNQDASCVPTGTGDNCSYSPTATPVPNATPTPVIVPSTITPVPPTATPALTNIPTPTPVDRTPPTVSIISPLTGTTVSHGTLVKISAQATDNIGVTQVGFYINGSLLGTAMVAPYSYNWSVPGKPNATYTITATAYDQAGNNATSKTVTIKSSK